MFNKEENLGKFKNAETIIGASVKVKGNFQGQGNIIVEGILDGSLKTKSNLFIGEKSKVTANIEVNSAVINGTVMGNITAKKYLAIGNNAKITGNIKYQEISIEKGAIINGQINKIDDNVNIKTDIAETNNKK